MEFTPEFWSAVFAIGQLGTFIVVAVTSIAGYRKYKETKHKDRLAKDFEIRRDFVLESKLYEIQGKIEHENGDLAEILNLIVNAENPYAPGLLTDTQERLQQQLDNYINFLEAVGSLRSRNWLQREDYAGFWDYYFRRIREWDVLWKYVSNPECEWCDVVEWAKNTTDRFRR